MKEKMKEVKLLVPVGKKAECVNGVLTLVKDKDARPVTERIKTFEDACEELGINPEEWMAENETYKENADILAYLKLRIITLALNEGWKPSFAKGEYRYYPWYSLFTKEDIDAMDVEDKEKLLLVGGSSVRGSLCGLSAASSSLGSRSRMRISLLAWLSKRANLRNMQERSSTTYTQTFVLLEKRVHNPLFLNLQW